MSKMIFWNKLRSFLFLLLICCSAALQAQVTSSPYSRYGLGDFQFNGFAQNLGMGAGGIGMRNDSLLPQYINLANPASLSSNNVVAYEVGMQSNTVRLRNTSDQSIFNRSTLSHIGMAFPVAKWWSASIGLVPYSSVGYSVSNTEQHDTLGAVTYRYEGSGGISQVFSGHAVRPFAGLTGRYKNSETYELLLAKNDTAALRKALRLRSHLANISLGAQVSYLFGPLSNVRRDIFPDSSYMLNTKITRTTLVHDVYANYGIQYRFRLAKIVNPKYRQLKKDADSLFCGKNRGDNYFTYKSHPDSSCNRKEPLRIRDVKGDKGLQVSFGAVFALPMSVRATSDLLGQTYRLNGGFEVFKDTIYNQSDVSGRLGLPAMAGFGFALKQDYRWQFQADYAMQMWENFNFLGEETDLRNSQRFTAGLQIQPKSGGRKDYLGNVQYRVGFRYYQTYLELKGNRLTEYGVTMGLGFPALNLTRVNLGLELGRRGTTENNLIQEDYIRVMLGISINDRWFQRPKYD